jgi:uncharacterized protein (DUF433 family)
VIPVQGIAMTIAADPLPMVADEHGVIRVSGTRVTLDTLLDHYNQGYAVDDLHTAFPSIPVADIHTVIGHYLRHKGEVDAYLGAKRREAEDTRRKSEAVPGNALLRQRLHATKRAREEGRGASAAGG